MRWIAIRLTPMLFSWMEEGWKYGKKLVRKRKQTERPRRKMCEWEKLYVLKYAYARWRHGLQKQRFKSRNRAFIPGLSRVLILKPTVLTSILSSCLTIVTEVSLNTSQRTLTMFMGVVTLRYQHHVLITECHNFHKHNQSPLTT